MRYIEDVIDLNMLVQGLYHLTIFTFSYSKKHYPDYRSGTMSAAVNLKNRLFVHSVSEANSSKFSVFNVRKGRNAHWRDSTNQEMKIHITLENKENTDMNHA